MAEKDDKIYHDSEGRVIAGGRQVAGPEPRTLEERRARREIINRQLGIGGPQEAGSPGSYTPDLEAKAEYDALQEQDPDFETIQRKLAEHAVTLPEDKANRLATDHRAFLDAYGAYKKSYTRKQTDVLDEMIRGNNPDFSGIEREGQAPPPGPSKEEIRRERIEQAKERMQHGSPTEKAEAEIEYAKALFEKDE